jgi:hypothetical protein
MAMKRHMLIWFFISMLVDREKKWGNYKMEVVFGKGGIYLLRNLIGKWSIYFLNEIIKFENEVVILKIVFAMVHGQQYQRIPKKSPLYQFQLLVTGIRSYVIAKMLMWATGIKLPLLSPKCGHWLGFPFQKGFLTSTRLVGWHGYHSFGEIL